MSQCVVYEKPNALASEEWELWREWLPWSVSSGWIDWAWQRLPEDVRILLFDYTKKRRFSSYNIRQHRREKGELALFGSPDATFSARGSLVGGTWQILARWTYEEERLVQEKIMWGQLRKNFSRELTRSTPAAIMRDLSFTFAVLCVLTVFIALKGINLLALVFFVCAFLLLWLQSIFETCFDRAKKKRLLAYLNKG